MIYLRILYKILKKEKKENIIIINIIILCYKYYNILIINIITYMCQSINF